ncbi:MAG: GNAT family N-acetyltransferase [Candidatus Omnitrophica bacterium]|nr:GNAT family N-acetyltransferase [Candidatus Omnitrophota bacterium]
MTITNAASQIDIRTAAPEDCPAIHSMICELAEYENLRDAVQSTPADLSDALFGENACAEAILAFYENQPIGFALFFTTFSTFVGRPGIYLEDLYVKPAHRGKGVGKSLLGEIARIARERKCGRLEWAVLNWNEPAIRFYQSIGAKPLSEWTVNRLDGGGLSRLASGGKAET